MRFAAAVSCLALLSACAPEPAMDMHASEAVAERWLDGVDVGAWLDCAREQGVTFLSAHRAGPRPGYAENDHATMLQSAADGAVFIEFDIGLTADDRLVLMHDRTIDRTTTGRGTVEAMTFDEITVYNLVDNDGRVLEGRPDEFHEFMAAIDGLAIAQLDLKGSLTHERLLEAVRAAGALDRVLIITYRLDQAVEVHRAEPRALLSVGMSSIEDLDALEAEGVDLSRIVAWLGLGQGDRELDAALAERGVETSYGDFRAEREGRADYAAMAANGAEILAVDNVREAAEALNAREAARRSLEACPAARVGQN